MRRGLLIVIEGVDGAGKTTQCDRVIKWLQQSGRQVVTFDFPGYDRSMFGKIIGGFLKGDFGDPVIADPFQSTLLFAGDRLHDQARIVEALERGCHVVLNRYVQSNVAYSCAKLRLTGRRSEVARFLSFSDSIEHQSCGLPRADLVVLLDIDPENAMVDAKAPRAYLKGESRDKHESSRELQAFVRSAYLELAEAEPDVWNVIQCCGPDGHVLSVDAIHEEVKRVLNSALDRPK